MVNCIFWTSGTTGFRKSGGQLTNLGLNIIASDIPANKEVPLPSECFFPVGNVDALSNALLKSLYNSMSKNFSEIIRSEYNWDTIAEKTKSVYYETINN